MSAPAMAARIAGIIVRRQGRQSFVCSIVAPTRSRASSKWHYQEVPEEDWDYTCTSTITVATLPIGGKARRVVMHAPKNGYFYVLDAATGTFISAKPYVPVNWGTVDPKTGKATVAPGKHYGTDPELLMPGPGGGHNWFPMAYSPRTKLAYFPTFESGFGYAYDPNWTPKPFRSNSGWGGYSGDALKKRAEIQKQINAMEKTFLVAWDPVKQQAAWRVQLPRHGNRRRDGHRQRPRLRGHDQADLRGLRREDRQAHLGNAGAERAGRRADHLHARRCAIYCRECRLGRRRGADRARLGHRAAACLGAAARLQDRRQGDTSADEGGRRRPIRRRSRRARRRSHGAPSSSPTPAPSVTANRQSAG